MGTARSASMSRCMTGMVMLAMFLLANSDDSENWEVEFNVNLEPGKQGKFVVEVFPGWAPLGAARFRDLVESNFFKGARFFRVIDNFMAQNLYVAHWSAHD